MMNFISRLLNSKSTFKYLLIFNGILSCILFYLFRDMVSGDQENYLSYAQGMEYGRFSQWWFLQDYVPDTATTPGYPFFLFLVEKISRGLYFIKAIQLLLYTASVYLMLQITEMYDSGYRLKNIFLLLLLPYVQVALFSVTIQPEALMTFLLTLYVYVDLSDFKPEWKFSILGLLGGGIFLVRPAFLFFPILLFIFNYINQRKTFPIGLGISMLVIYFLSILPYGIWNLKNHHVISITPIEGVKNNVTAFTAETNFIDSSCAQYLSPQDKFNLAEMDSYNGYLKTYNSKYTLAKEKLIRKLNFEHFKEKPLDVIKTKLTTLTNLWFSGMQLSEPNTLKQSTKFYKIYFSSVSIIFFLASTILIPLALYRKKISWASSQTAIILIIYFGLAHVFFTLQAKYTIPLRLIVLLLLARTILGLFSNADFERKNNL